MKHQYVVTYTKRTNLLDYMHGNRGNCAVMSFCREDDAKQHYAKERDVR